MADLSLFDLTGKKAWYGRAVGIGAGARWRWRVRDRCGGLDLNETVGLRTAEELRKLGTTRCVCGAMCPTRRGSGGRRSWSCGSDVWTLP